MKVLFFGTPQIAVNYLKELIKNEEVVGAVTQPDRPADRGYRVHSPPVKELAQEYNLPVFQPEKFTPEIIERIKSLKPDVGVAIAYGKLIPESVFRLPDLGCFNIHFSLLPKYRGAAPVQWALINGEKETGVTTFWIEKTLDSGPILLKKSLPISDDDNSLTLTGKLMHLGIEAMYKTIEGLKKGDCKGRLQEGEPSFAPSLKKEDGRINWSKSALQIYNIIRGTVPWPGAYTVINEGKLKGRKIKILKAQVLSRKQDEVAHNRITETAVGQIVELIKNVGFVVSCSQGFLEVEEVHLENKKPVDAWAFLQGGHFKVGDVIFC